MGINLVWVCEKHKRYHISMRGEEGIDFQYFVRDMNWCPRPCLKEGSVTVWHDGYFIHDGYIEMFPNWGDRPAERLKAQKI